MNESMRTGPVKSTFMPAESARAAATDPAKAAPCVAPTVGVAFAAVAGAVSVAGLWAVMRQTDPFRLLVPLLVRRAAQRVLPARSRSRADRAGPFHARRRRPRGRARLGAFRRTCAEHESDSYRCCDR
jgi:hypothetical protein